MYVQPLPILCAGASITRNKGFSQKPAQDRAHSLQVLICRLIWIITLVERCKSRMAMYHHVDLSEARDLFGYGLYGVTGCTLPFLVEYSTSRAGKKFQDELMAIANCKTRHHLFAS